jgi:hypothetical protein
MTLARFKPAIEGAVESQRLRSRGHWELPYVLIGHDISLFFVSEKFLELAVQYSEKKTTICDLQASYRYLLRVYKFLNHISGVLFFGAEVFVCIS